jgi:hypothetical protein
MLEIGVRLARGESVAKSAQFLKEIKERPEKYYIVHYSSESLYDKTIQGNAPRITSIVVIHYATGQITSFAIHTVADILNIHKQNVVAQYDTIEAEMLRQFYDFAAPRAHLSWIHWNMRSVVFGFEHLSHRYEVLTGKKATDIPVESRVNLNDMLRDKYGDLYVPHKQMPNLIHMQGEMPKDYLTGEQESKCFANQDYIRMHLSTIGKVQFFAYAIRQMIAGKLKTSAKGIGVMIDRLLDSRANRVTVFTLSLLSVGSWLIFFALKARQIMP